MRHAKQTLAIVSLSLALAGCHTPAIPAHPTPATASIQLVADEESAPLLRELADAYHPPNTLIAWRIQSGSWANVDEWLNEGRATFALTSYMAEDSKLWSTPIGQDGLAIVVNRSNAIGALTTTQLRAVITGRILNWREVGGPDLPITVISRPEASSSAATLRRLLIGERKISGSAILATSTSRVSQLVGSVPGAIGYQSQRYSADEGIRVVSIDGAFPTAAQMQTGQYALTMPILFVGKAAPADDAPYRAFFAWAQSPAGQEIVAQHYAGLVPGR
jgi:phosphate transport system substrate-binding protein